MSQPQPIQTHTRASCGPDPDHIPTREELVKMHQILITSAQQAQEYLEKQGYTPPDVQGSKAPLSYTLLLLAHCTLPSLLPKAIRPVAAVLECEETTKTTNTIVAAVMHRLNLVLNLIYHVADMAQEAIEDTRKAADWLYRMS